MKAVLVALCVLWILSSGYVLAESVFVQFHGIVDLRGFICAWVSRSSFVNRVCYKLSDRHLVILLGNTYYHHCRIPPNEVAGLINADSIGRYYNAYIKGRYECRRS